MEMYKGKIRHNLKSIKVKIIDDSGILKYQDDVTIVIHSDASAMLLIDFDKAVERQRMEWDNILDDPLP